MKINVGKIDRIARVILGIGLLSMVFVGPQTPWGYIGLIPLITGIFGFCGIYQILGISTCPLKK